MPFDVHDVITDDVWYNQKSFNEGNLMAPALSHDVARLLIFLATAIPT